MLCFVFIFQKEIIERLENKEDLTPSGKTYHTKISEFTIPMINLIVDFLIYIEDLTTKSFFLCVNYSIFRRNEL